MGSRNSQTTMYWNDEKTQVICGCFSGSLEEFKTRVEKTHGHTKYGEEYQKLIKLIKLIKENE